MAMAQYPTSLEYKLECKETGLPRYGRPIHGYGNKIPTPYMVRFRGRFRRVYAACYGNSATLYIGKPGEWLGTIESIDGRPT